MACLFQFAALAGYNQVALQQQGATVPAISDSPPIRWPGLCSSGGFFFSSPTPSGVVLCTLSLTTPSYVPPVDTDKAPITRSRPALVM